MFLNVSFNHQENVLFLDERCLILRDDYLGFDPCLKGHNLLMCKICNLLACFQKLVRTNSIVRWLVSTQFFFVSRLLSTVVYYTDAKDRFLSSLLIKTKRFFDILQEKGCEDKALHPGDKLALVNLCPGDACHMKITVLLGFVWTRHSHVSPMSTNEKHQWQISRLF